jgi:hypothetical protein
MRDLPHEKEFLFIIYKRISKHHQKFDTISSSTKKKNISKIIENKMKKIGKNRKMEK